MFALRRGVQFCRTVRTPSVQSKRTLMPGKWEYRKPIGEFEMPIEAKVYKFLIWYWILANITFRYEEFLPHFCRVDPRTFTDNQLGIPPDSEDA